VELTSSEAVVEEHWLAAQRAAELYFGAPAMTGLQREFRFLPLAGRMEADARVVIAALAEGSLCGGVSPWPRRTAVNDVFVTREGIVFVDFDAGLREKVAPGDAVEWLLAASLTRTLCANFPALHGVRILVGGESAGPLLHQIPLDWTLTSAMFEERP